ncbi:hypothetical protein GCM10023205_15490 [Yinghuangia aomiensis]|uniref:Secreted protein n=1 Tax=Yinghuangia aomiensis TaxID=676205 RepID=A0ABP9GW88_9ACTN
MRRDLRILSRTAAARRGARPVGAAVLLPCPLSPLQCSRDLAPTQFLVVAPHCGGHCPARSLKLRSDGRPQGRPSAFPDLVRGVRRGPAGGPASREYPL